ncbi:MAG: hypothetical protein AAFU73_18880 [Planctomycetota bacterium]
MDPWNAQAPLRGTGTLLLAREAVFYVAFYVLGSSIGWPASLGLPAHEALPLIHQNARSVHVGYYLYLVSSLMFVPVVLSLRSTLYGRDPRANLFLDVAAGFAVVSAVMRALGILRWLFAMPALAVLDAAPDIGEHTRAAVHVQFDVLNAYAGQAGEHLGVQLTGALFVGSLALAFVRLRVQRAFTTWLAFSAVLFLPWGDYTGVDSGLMLFVNGMTFSTWAIVFGLYLIRTGGRRVAGRAAS